MSKSSIHSSFAVNAAGVPLGSASVTVSTLSISGVVGSLASLYADAELTVSKSNPFVADSLGNYSFYAAPGLYQISVSANGSTDTYNAVLSPLSPTGTLFANEYGGGSVSAQIDAAIADAGTAQTVVVIPSGMGAGWPLNGVPSNVAVWDMRGNGGSTQTAYVRGTSFYNRVTAVGAGLQIPSTILIEHDAFSGGVNSFPGGAGTKTQFQPLRIALYGRTIGEKKGIQVDVNNSGKGDNIGIMASTYDCGGYSTGGDEGSEGGRFSSYQGDGTADGGFPRGTVAAVATNLITGTWTAGTNGNLGEQRPLINTSRAVYSTGTISTVTGAGSPTVCTVTGAATGWTALGTGAKTDLFLEITGNSNGVTKHVVPVLSITDDTHLIVEYNLSEIGATTFGVSMVTSGAYNIYKGGMVSSLATPPSGQLKPTGVNLASGGSNFQVGDTIQQPLGYNYHGRGTQIVLSRLVGEPQGGGVYVNNNNPAPYRDAYRSSGFFQNGISFDTGTLSGSGVFFNMPVTGPLLAQNDISAATQAVIQTLNGSLSVRQVIYDRTNDEWIFNGGQYFSASDQRIGIGTTPQTNTLGYIFWNNANWTGLILAPGTAATNNGKPYFGVQLAGIPLFQVEKTRVVVSNGIDLVGFSDNETTQKWSVTGSSGSASFSTLTAQNVTGSLGVTNSGDNIMPPFAWSLIANGANNNVTDFHSPVARITAPTGNFNITGINPSSTSGATDGILRELYNATSFTMTINHENALSTAANRITAPQGVDFTAKCVRMVYSTAASRWLVLSYI